MLVVRAKVGPSAVHGLGLIAGEFVPRGAVVWELRPGVDLELTDEQIDALPAAGREQLLWYCDGDYDPVRGVHTLSADDARFTNHSDTPNTVTAEGGRVTVATADIHPGDEITWDYQSWAKDPAGGGRVPAGGPDGVNPRRELIALLRGRFAAPLIAALSERGFTTRMADGPFGAASFPGVRNGAALRAAFAYLQSLGLVVPVEGDGLFTLTELGRSVFRRDGAFLILESYRAYFDRFADLLDGTAEPTVDRRRNVLGSGSLHRGKFFPAALALVRHRAWACVADVGCGGGTFLACALQEHPAVTAVAVDLSALAVRETTARLAGHAVRPVVADAADVTAWAGAVPDAGPTLVTLWFVVHEFSRGEPARVVEFFRRLAAALPAAEVLVGEVVALPADRLAACRHDSIMPEFLLFHALSGQGVLRWEQFQEVLRTIPYTLAGELRFDPVAAGDGMSQPSSFVWHLTPIRA